MTGLTRELSVPAEIGLKVPLFLSCAAQVGVVDRLKASPSICRMARTMMSRLFLGLGSRGMNAAGGALEWEAIRGLFVLCVSASDPSLSSKSSSSSEGVGSSRDW